MAINKCGIDNYGLYPLDLSAIDTLKWAAENGADGVAFSGFTKSRHPCLGELADIRDLAKDLNLYLEWGGGQHIPFDLTSWMKKDLFENNLLMAQEASILNTPIIRSCSGGLMRWNKHTPQTELLLKETAKVLKEQKNMLKEHGVILALETHFEFTTFELLRLFEMCDTYPGEYLGICLDTMNLFTMLEDPLMATQRVLPWVVSTHLKDGCMAINENGLLSFPVQIGEGQVDLERIILLLNTLKHNVFLSVEDHGGSFELPVFDPFFLSSFPDLEVQEYTRLIEKAHQTVDGTEDWRKEMTARNDWADLCETRIKNNVLSLKNIVSSL